MCQVPFFPPLQRAEQYTVAKCRSILEAAAGMALPDLDVRAARPWTMHAQVATQCAPPRESLKRSPPRGAESRSVDPGPVQVAGGLPVPGG